MEAQARWRLTVKLRGRPEAPDQAPRAHNLFNARGADTQTVHGPLQRLLDGPYRLVRAAAIASPVAAVMPGVAGIPTAIATCAAAIPPGEPVTARAPFTRKKPNR